MSTKLKAGTSTSGAVLDADTTGILELQTGSTPTTAVYVDASQNVGVGTSSPSVPLAIYKASDSAINIQNSTSGVTNVDGLQLLLSGSNGYMWNYESGANIFGTANTERMRIDSSGNVGIGTASPSQKLDVANAMQISYGGSNTYCYFQSTNNYVGRATSGDMWLNTANAQNISFGVGGSEKMRIDSSGVVMIGKTTNNNTSNGFQVGQSGQELSVNRSGDRCAIFGRNTNDGSIVAFFKDGNTVGSISVSGSNVAYNTSSDYRLKENIAPMQNALNVVQSLKPCTFTWKQDGKAGQGFIAHELAEVAPECVNGEKDAVDEEGKPVYQGIDTSFLVATLTAAIQELNAKVTALEAQLGAK